jgi:hypothetical protein
MTITTNPGAALVILLYLLSLVVILVVSRRLFETKPGPWWRSVRLWASFVAVVQILVYAIWG